MSQLDALRLIHSLRERLVDFTIEETYLRDDRLRDILGNVWRSDASGGGLLSDVWVEAAFGAKPAAEHPHTLSDLVAVGEFDKSLAEHLDARGAVPSGRSLYEHQRGAIRASQSSADGRPGIMVTASTGAGKTESFLLPVLNDLWSTPRASDETGVRCIILYPMNALVNDQISRLYSWLQGQHRITLFHFTSETPEDHGRANRIGVPRWARCRFRTRQQARGLETAEGRKLDHVTRGPVPDVLITNYSMLEYMLSRPQDAVFFDKALRAIVLDEAHLYTGTLAAEIALLLRRVLIRCDLRSEQVLHIGTSATLGEGDLGKLGTQLFSKPASLVRVLKGTRKSPAFAEELRGVNAATLPDHRAALAALSAHSIPTLKLDAEGNSELTTDSTAIEVLSSCVQSMIDTAALSTARSQSDGKPAVFLYRTLSRVAIVQELARVLWEEERISLPDLAKRLWSSTNPESIAATIALLRLSSSARLRAADLPLVPHRLHVLCRCADGAVVCLSPRCSSPDAVRPVGWGAICTGFAEQCPHCQSRTLSVLRCAECGHAVIGGRYSEDLLLEPVPPGEFAGQDHEAAVRRARGVQIFAFDAPPSAIESVHVNVETGEVGGRGDSTRQLFIHKNSGICPRCGAEADGTVPFEPIAGPLSLTLSVVAETVVAELPEHASSDRAFLPARGRRLLAFTDSRQGAAKLGPRLTAQHETQVVRSAIVRAVRAHSNTPELETYLGDRVRELRRTLETAPASISDTIRRDLARAESELSGARTGMSIEALVDVLRQSPQIVELIDLDSAGAHESNPEKRWSETDWNANAKKVQSVLQRMICEELAIPLRPHRATSAEAVGLIEIVLPRIELLALDDSSPWQHTEPRHALERTFATLPRRLAEALRQDWLAFVTELVLDLRRNMASTLGLGEIEDEEFARALVGSAAVAGLHLARAQFTGETERAARLARVAGLLRDFGVPSDNAVDVAREFLGNVFDFVTLGATSTLQVGEFPWLEVNDAGGTRLNLSKVYVRRPKNLWASLLTGLVYPRSVLGRALLQGVSDLQPITFEDAMATPRLVRRRHELLGTNNGKTDVFGLGLWGEEHSAQLSPQENLRLQNLFRDGVRNVLSSTTTLELGIDIGGLAGVLLTDVPPGVANYIQRSGRAGRRADGSSIVVTFVRPRPFDREVFHRFSAFLSQSPPTPNVFLDRRRIVERHAHSYLLGEFFKAVYPVDAHVGAMSAYRLIGEFCGARKSRYWEPKQDSIRPDTVVEQGVIAPLVQPPWWPDDGLSRSLRDLFSCFLEHIATHKNDRCRVLLLELVCGTPLDSLRPAESDAMSDFLRQAGRRLDTAASDWQALYAELLQSWEQIDGRDTSNASVSNALHRNLEAMYTTTTIEALADAQYLPRYGFPIGVQRLAVWTDDLRKPSGVREEDRYRLERSGMLALREYAPGATLVVGGNVVRSRGLMKHWTGVDKPETLGLRGHGFIGPQGRFVYRIGDGELPTTFPSSGDSTRFAHQFELLFPRHGFSTAWWDRPMRTRALEEPVGTVQLASSAVIESGEWDETRNDFAGIRGLHARYKECGELLVYNPGNVVNDNSGRPRFTGFAICTRCGYADIERNPDGQGRMKLPHSFEQHRPLRRQERRSNCWSGVDGAPVLRHQVLAARQTTDVLVLDFGNLIPTTSARIAKTVAEALRLAGARCLQLNPRELGARFHPSGEDGFSIVVFDIHPGGAGHVLELFTRADEWMGSHLHKVLFVSDEHNHKCRTACLDCLRTFGEPSEDDGIEFDRVTTLKWFNTICKASL